MTSGFALFDSALGTCGVAWHGAGIVAVQLPEDSPERTRERLAATAGALDVDTREHEPPAEVAAAVDAMRQHFAGTPDDLRWVPLDFGGISDFDTRVYDITRSIGPGQVSTYGDVAADLGGVGAAQAVGQALGRNPFPLVVPCHRVLAADGGIGGFSAGGGTVTKRELLALEGAPGFGDPVLF